ncbi:hypothetical protein SteCoe_10804 [Stentor coeruleus]|uniref:RRM domain-containing protein n=1 Tax=Stentor coeruleus TaxID=5963 RepID=A0A1R2CEN8_9CILI|nr:hypothetical protein SteCoe_10804 [Stentor coeruleus]
MSLFLGDLPPNINEELLTSEYQKFGRCKVKFCGKFAFIDFFNEKSTKQAYMHSKGKLIEGKLIQVHLNYSTPQILENPVIFPLQNPIKSLVSPVKIQASHTKILEDNSIANWDFCEPEAYFDPVSESVSPNKPKLKPIPIPRHKRGRKKTGEDTANPVVFIDHNTVTAYGNVFKVKSICKKDGNSIIKCEVCNRKFKKKSIRSHVISKLHQDKFSQ